MKQFFENAKDLDIKKQISVPTVLDLTTVMEIIRDDIELTQYFYDKLSPNWLDLLESIEEFKGLDVKEAGIVERYKTAYLFDCAETRAALVLKIIKGIRAQDVWVQGKLIGAISKMSEEIAFKGVPVVLDYIGKREQIVWFFYGEEAAKLMVNLTDNYLSDSLKIAKALLEVWRPEEKEARAFERIRRKFATHEYKELMFNYYRKVWEKRPFEAIQILIEIYDQYINEFIKKKNYDVSELLGISLRDLEDDYHLDRNIEAIIVRALCEAGQAVIEKEPAKIDELFDDFEKRDKGVFHRIEMHLLRFVPQGTQSDRINKIISNQKFIENPLYRYEHRRLLNDKFDEIDENVKDTFLEWIEKPKITDKKKKEIEQWCHEHDENLQDFGKWENQKKAEELYLVRDRFRKEFDEYLEKSGIKEASAAPRSAVISKTRIVSPMEGTPLGPEEMAKRVVSDVLDYILEPKNYQSEQKTEGWQTPEYALKETFKVDVKKRPLEYLECDSLKLQKLNPGFLSNLFFGIWDAIREGSFQKTFWPNLINLMQNVTQDNHKRKEYQNCFHAMLDALRDGFTQENMLIEFDKNTIEELLYIVSKLVRFEEEYHYSEHERDPVQMRGTSVKGQASEQIVELGIACKEKGYYEGQMKDEIRQLLDYVVNDVKKPEVNCTLGIDFNKIGWMDDDWLKENVEKIFEVDMWDVVWGTHVSWGRPYRPGFALLKKKGIYNTAIEKLNTKNNYRFRKDPNEGFAEHLMIAFFNGWIELNDPLIENFYQKASAKLRGYAARFLTTGFKPEKEEGGDYSKVSERLKAYWKKRLKDIEEEPDKNIDELVEFTGWIEDSLIESRGTLELLNETLTLCKGKIGKRHDADDLIESICEIGKKNELIALQCLKKVAADENVRMLWVHYQPRLIEFLESITNLPESYCGIEDIRTEAIAVADAYGRLFPEKFREVWEKLVAVRNSMG